MNKESEENSKNLPTVPFELSKDGKTLTCNCDFDAEIELPEGVPIGTELTIINKGNGNIFVRAPKGGE